MSILNTRSVKDLMMYLQMVIEAMSTVHASATDYKPGEIEIGIVLNSLIRTRRTLEEDEKVRGKWRVMGASEAEIEEHLLAYAEKD
jgi:hypothetical protein